MFKKTALFLKDGFPKQKMDATWAPGRDNMVILVTGIVPGHFSGTLWLSRRFFFAIICFFVEGQVKKNISNIYHGSKIHISQDCAWNIFFISKGFSITLIRLFQNDKPVVFQMLPGSFAIKKVSQEIGFLICYSQGIILIRRSQKSADICHHFEYASV